MAGLLQIRDVPNATRQALKARAAAQGRSLNAYLLELLNEQAARPAVAEVLARAQRRADRSLISSVDLIREDRDERARA